MTDLPPGSPELLARNADRVLGRVSPSQVEAFELCERRWYNASILGFREEETEAMRRGTEIGKEVEDYYEHGKLPSGRYAELAKVVLPLLGPRKPSVKCEEWVESPSFEGGPKVRGRLDHFDSEIIPRTQGQELHLMRGKPVGPAQPLHPRPLAMLSDVKSKSKALYFHTVESLGQDLQLNVYAWAKVRDLGLPELGLQHAYTMTTGNPKGVPVRTVVTPESLRPRWLQTVESVRSMSAWARQRPTNADPLPPNTKACDKFPPLGCPHRARCGFEPSLAGALKTARPTQEEPKMSTGPSLMERLNAAKDALLTGGTPAAPAPAPAAAAPAAAASTPVPAAAAPAPAPAPIPAAAPAAAPAVDDPVGEALKKIMAGTLKLDGSGQIFTKEGADKGWIMRPPTMAESIAFEESAKQAGKVEQQIATETPAGPAVVPSDAPSRASTPEEIAAASAPKEKKTRAKKAEAAPAAAAEGSGAPTPNEAELAQIAEEKRRAQPGNIRRDGKLLTVGEIEDLVSGVDQPAAPAPAAPEPAPVAAAPAAAPPAAAPTPPPAPAERAGALVSDELAVGPVIYIDCFPVKGPHRQAVVHFEEWMAPICEEVARKKGVVDWRLIQYTAKGDLAAEVRGVLSTLPAVIHVSKFAPSADVFLECVVPWASQIIRGI